MELSEHAEEGDVLARIVYNSLGTVLDKEFEQLKGLLTVSLMTADDTMADKVPCRSAAIPLRTCL